MADLRTAQDYQDCVAGVHGQHWQDAANDLIERGHEWPGEAFWAEWTRIRAKPRHTLTEYGTTTWPVEGVRANVDDGECSACGAGVDRG